MPNLKGQNIEELLINTSININFRIMNKKFSTLLAGAALLGAVSANGAIKLNEGANRAHPINQGENSLIL